MAKERVLILKLGQDTKGYLLMGLSGALYGSIGIFAGNLSNYNIPSYVIAFFSPFIAFLVIFIYLLVKKREYLKLGAKDLFYLMILGLTSQAISNQLFFAAVEKTSVAVATVLIYMSPIFVVILARFLYKELWTLPKMIALVVSVTGCFLAATGGSLELLKINSLGLLLGLGAGFTFALLPIMSKNIAGKVHFLTIACYTMGFGAIFSFIIIGPQAIWSIDYNINIGLNMIGLGVISNAIGYLFYTKGMSYGIQSSKASIITTIEVPVAALLSFIFFQEDIFGVKLLGIILVVSSVIIIEYGDQIMLKWSEVNRV